jgi:hypothetical protein
LPRSCVQRSRDRKDIPRRFTPSDSSGCTSAGASRTTMLDRAQLHEGGAGNAIGRRHFHDVIARRGVNAEPGRIAGAQRNLGGPGIDHHLQRAAVNSRIEPEMAAIAARERNGTAVADRRRSGDRCRRCGKAAEAAALLLRVSAARAATPPMISAMTKKATALASISCPCRRNRRTIGDVA